MLFQTLMLFFFFFFLEHKRRDFDNLWFIWTHAASWYWKHKSTPGMTVINFCIKNMVKQVRRATDLSFRATKEMARAICRSMAALVAVERHLWLNFSDTKENDFSWTLHSLLLASLATQWIRSSRGFRRQKSRWKHSNVTSLTELRSLELLGGSSPSRWLAPHIGSGRHSQMKPPKQKNDLRTVILK